MNEAKLIKVSECTTCPFIEYNRRVLGVAKCQLSGDWLFPKEKQLIPDSCPLLTSPVTIEAENVPAKQLTTKKE